MRDEWRTRARPRDEYRDEYEGPHQDYVAVECRAQKRCATSLKTAEEQLQAEHTAVQSKCTALITSDNAFAARTRSLVSRQRIAARHLSPELHVLQATHRTTAAPARSGNARDATCNLVNNGAALATKTGSGAPRGRAGCAGIVRGSSDAHHVRPRRPRQGAARCTHQIVVACRHRCDVRRFGSTRLND